MPFFLMGCSNTFTYNNLDWLLYWYLDDYVELDKQQKKQFDVKLESWLEWHRSGELPRYQAHLESIKQRLNVEPLTASQWLQEFSDGRDHWSRLRNHISPGLIEFSKVLNDEQVEQLFVALEKENIENEEERAESSAEQRAEKNVKRMKANFKDWIGKLSKQQEKLVEDYSPQFTTNFENWIAYRRHIQSSAKQLMMTRNEDPQYSEKMLTLFQSPELYQSQQYKEVSDYNRNLYADLLFDLTSTLSSKQKKKMNKEIDDLIEDVTDLIED